MQKRIAVWLALPLLLVVTLFALLACCCPGPHLIPASTALAPPLPPAVTVPLDVVPAKETDVQMRNVRFHIDPSNVLHIRELRGQMFDQQSGRPLNFDDKHSFIVRIFSARIGIDGPSLAGLMNRYVFNDKSAPLRNLSIQTGHEHLVLEGILHKIIDIPFRMTAIPSVTPSGAIRIHPTRIEICNLNGAALMKAFGISLEKVMTRLPRGVSVRGNDLDIEPLTILPAPRIEGKLIAVEVENAELVQTFDDGRGVPPLPDPQPPAANFMSFQRGTLRMGKLFMVSADMQVIDTDPSDPFDFFIDRYNEQLVAGFDHNRLNYGLTVYMRDFDDLGQPARPGERLLH